MRLDLLLVRLRFARSRSVAQRWIEAGHMRCSGSRVTSAAHGVQVGDVLTLPIGRGVRIVELVALPERRGPAAEAQMHYRVLDAPGSIAIAGSKSHPQHDDLAGEQEGHANP